ncbi:reverse transcriptase-like protein [Nymphaea thermarum]|nr:reverse transcriptase-like protein [Nymphaea thermarum]
MLVGFKCIVADLSIKFGSYLIKAFHIGIVATVPNWWARAVDGRWAAFRLSRKLHLVRREAIAWKRFFWSGKFSEVAEWDEEILSLQAAENISAVQSSRLLCLQGLTQEWRIRESIHWQQRSRLGWLAHGDQNSRFFHLAASQRRRQTLLQSMNIGGRVFLGDDILPALSAHFRDFYSKPLRFRATLPDFHLSPLSVSCAISLERPFLHQEIKNAVWALSSGKAPGIDGFPLAVSFNGKCGDFFSLEPGLRQGCPLSPLLFNLVAESFSALFQHATVVGFLAPQSLPHLQTFSTIQYADDFLLFGCASRQQIVRTWLILRIFELISGLSINSAKCHLSLIHADPATVLLAEACFGCKATSLPMDYLGLQITLSPPAPSFWNGVEQKLTDRLQCWQGKLLSLPGRITLAKHCLASVPLHALVVFRPPVAVLRRFDKLIRKFIWNGDRPSDRLAHWDVVVFPRLLGGAGVTNLSRASESSLCSWWWRVLAYVWPSLVGSLPNPPSIRLLFFFCPSPHLTVSWGHVWRPWLISAWWRIWEEHNNRVFRDTFSSPDSVARIVQGDVQFAIRLKRRGPPAARFTKVLLILCFVVKLQTKLQSGIVVSGIPFHTLLMFPPSPRL